MWELFKSVNLKLAEKNHIANVKSINEHSSKSKERHGVEDKGM